MAKMSNRDKAIAKNAGVFQGPKSVADRKAAAASMKSAGVQSLSGLSGSQGQVARFKSEQNNLRNEYKDKNTSDERKEEIVKDLRGVSRDLNDQSRAAALNQVIREFGPGSVTNTGGIMGADAGARFQQLRGNPNFFVDGGPGTDTFVGNQREFKRGNITNVMGGIPKAFGDKNLFKQVHPNPLKVLLGAATQMGNLSPMGLVRNIEKIRTGQPLIDMSFMDRNKSESPSRMKDFYSAYMKEMNKKIADAKSSKNAQQFDAVPLDPQFKDFLPDQIETEDMNLDPAVLLARDEETTRYGTPAGAEPGPTTDIDDEEFSTLLNQYSLLNQDDLADSLLDDSETEKELTDTERMSQEEYDEELKNKLPFLYNQPTLNEDVVPGILDEVGSNYNYDNFDFNQNLGSILPTRDMLPEGGVSGTPVTQTGQQLFFADGTPVTEPVNTGLDMYGNKVMPSEGGSQAALDILNSNADPLFSGYPAMRFKDGGSVSTYDVLKLINDTMNDG